MATPEERAGRDAPATVWSETLQPLSAHDRVRRKAGSLLHTHPRRRSLPLIIGESLLRPNGADLTYLGASPQGPVTKEIQRAEGPE